MIKTKSLLIKCIDLSLNTRHIRHLSSNPSKLHQRLHSNDVFSCNSKNYYSNQRQQNFHQKRFNDNILKSGGILATIGSAFGLYILYTKNKCVLNAKTDTDLSEFGREVKGLKSYTSEEVAKHNDMSKRVWVSYRSGVYDITDFIGRHPGGSDKILMASGGGLEPFWTLFAVHKTKEIYTLLESYRIGNLAEDDRTVQKQSDDPYANDPQRHPTLRPRSVKPFNAEPPEELLVKSFLTPKNHLPVPEIDVKNYSLEIEGFGLKSAKSLTLDEIKSKFVKHSVIATIQCAGNRRDEMNKFKEVKGLEWGSAAISNAKWSGARLIDVLRYCGLDFDDKNIKYVQFEGLDFDVSSNPYGASVESLRALDPKADIIIAYEMNGEDIPLDHGFPLRLIVPGVVGARNVKWLARIVLSDEESHSHWQRKDYKSFSPNIDWENVDFDSALSIQELPIQSAICEPKEGQTVKLDREGNINLSGYAWSGGGRKVIRVDVSADQGLNWTTAELEQEDSPMNRTYSWTLWKANIPVPKGFKSGQKVELICKATDSHYNSQPEGVKNIWNLRGVINNSWHRISVCVK